VTLCRYFTEWALTVFSRGFSFDLVTRVWDVLLCEGQYKIVYRVALALLKVGVCFERYSQCHWSDVSC
jgi:hypothetical protein